MFGLPPLAEILLCVLLTTVHWAAAVRLSPEILGGTWQVLLGARADDETRRTLAAFNVIVIVQYGGGFFWFCRGFRTAYELWWC